MNSADILPIIFVLYASIIVDIRRVSRAMSAEYVAAILLAVVNSVQQHSFGPIHHQT